MIANLAGYNQNIYRNCQQEASGSFTISAGTTARKPFCIIAGGQSSTPVQLAVFIKRIGISMHVATADEAKTLRLTLYSSPHSGGVEQILVSRPIDKRFPTSHQDGKYYSVNGTTPGTVQGVIRTEHVLIRTPTNPPAYVEWDLTDNGRYPGVCLRTLNEELGLSFQEGVVNTITLAIWIEHAEVLGMGQQLALHA